MSLEGGMGRWRRVEGGIGVGGDVPAAFFVDAGYEIHDGKGDISSTEVGGGGLGGGVV